MRYLLLPLLALTVGCTTSNQYAMREKAQRVSQNVVLEDHHPRSVIGQDPITWDEVDLCDDLAYQAYNGPLSNRQNLGGSIGTCSAKTGNCAIYWLDTGLCDVVDKIRYEINPVPKPKKSKIEQLQDAIDHCHSSEPKFGPQPPCEMFEDQLWREMEKIQ
ncbi:MAG: hypothetical protein GY886_05945 [Gammaproteobacteria bacterium]|nr:hypothetical protein [Gammaproteobacteria bacterium]